MKGQVLVFEPLKGSGIISGEDGNRYRLEGSSWRGVNILPVAGLAVDFTPAGDNAEEVFPLPSANPLPGSLGSGPKSPIVAGLLALFFGQLGIHKFYLGYNTEGVILLVGTCVSFVLVFAVIGIIPLMVIGLVCLIEAIIYLTRSEADFNLIYVEGRKPWF